MEVAFLVSLIVINGFFAMSEIGLVSARRARLQPLIDSGDVGARIAVNLGTEPTRFLSTVQIGITSVGLLSGIVAEDALSPPLARDLQTWGLSLPAAKFVATATIVALLTYLSIVIGELVPKRIGQIYPEIVARLVARPIAWLAVASTPFVWLLTRSTEMVLRFVGIVDARRGQVTEDEIHAVLAEGSAAGAIEEREHQMVRKLLQLNDRTIVSFMTPRGDVAALELTATAKEVLAVLSEFPYARYPVVRGGLHDIVGVATTRRILETVLQGGSLDLQRSVDAALFVPERITGKDLLESFRAADAGLAFVVDEYGDVLGLVTVHDLLASITGEFGTANGGSDWGVLRDDGSWLLDGQIPLPELFERLQMHAAAAPPRADYQTLSGLVLSLLNRIPKAADCIDWNGWSFEIVDMDGHRIDKVLAVRRTVEPRS